MEEGAHYVVDITPEAEVFYYELLHYLYSSHSSESANRKSEEIMEMAFSLEKLPDRGRVEDKLAFLGMTHRYLLYEVTSRKTIKIIYFVVESKKKVFVTDFYPSEMDEAGIEKRNK